MGKTLKLAVGIPAAAGLLILAVLMLLVQLGVIEEGIYASEASEKVVPSPSESPAASESPDDDLFVLSLVGDCTLAGNRFGSLSAGNADYPFENVRSYFLHDDATIANLECNFSDAQLSSGSLFHFKAPTKNAEMLVAGGIDFVTTANNHTMDYGQRGLDDTLDALKSVGVAYGTDGGCALYTTERGLTLGIYCGYGGLMLSADRISEAVKQLKADGAEYIICALHWGDGGRLPPQRLSAKPCPCRNRCRSGSCLRFTPARPAAG